MPDDPLAIRDLRVWPLAEPASGRRYTVLKLTARNGLAGWGECGPIGARDLAAARSAVADQPATAFEPVRRRLLATPALEAGVVMAMLDLAARHAKAPLYQFLGGPTRFKARALAPLAGDTDQALLASLDRARAAGHRAFSAPVPIGTFPNQGQAFVLRARARLDALRKAAGPAADFVLDGGGSLTTGDAAMLAEAFERSRLLWFDEPCATAGLGALRKVAGENVTPIAFGRAIDDAAGFHDLLREEAADLLRPSLARHSLVSIRKLAATAETYYVAVAPYHDGGPIATAAALHLGASLPNFFIQQIPLPADPADRAMRAAIAGAPIERVAEGFAALPTGPGLGIDVDEKALEKYRERAA